MQILSFDLKCSYLIKKVLRRKDKKSNFKRRRHIVEVSLIEIEILKGDHFLCHCPLDIFPKHLHRIVKYLSKSSRVNIFD